MAAMLIYGKKLKNLLQNQWTDFNKTWYVASGTLAYHNLYKSRPLFDIDLIYDNSNLSALAFQWKKLKHLIKSFVRIL